MKKKVALGAVVAVLLAVCVMASGCLSLLTTTIGLIYYNALDTRNIEDREEVTGDDNPLGVTFENGKMYASWDATGSGNYSLAVTANGITTTYTTENSSITDGLLCLSDLGYTYWQNINLTLYYTENLNRTMTRGYNYKAINAETYDAYTKPVSAGFKEIDYYMGNRSEWFDFWSYLIIFRENYTLEQGCYEINSKVYMGYDYASLYKTTDIDQAFLFEVYSAIDAYEDSAAYSYRCEVDETGKVGTIYLKFLYGMDPKYTSDSGKSYQNATQTNNRTHYRSLTTETQRTFAIDSVANTISVSSSEQLYFTLKKGYRPVPVPGSNAAYLYDKMRSILNGIIAENDTDVTKVHAIYDYLVDTVIYDYDFTENVYQDENYTTGQLFSFRCLYMDGVFGLTDNGVFDDSQRIAICDGLSKAFMSLARIEGIEALKISGTVNNEGHAWNKVCIAGSWYMVDTTWGNELDKSTGKEYLSHEYLLVPDDSNHVETPYITYPAATSRYYFGSGISNNSGAGSSSGSSFRPFSPWWSRNPRYAA